MVTVAQVKNGLVRYIDTDVLPHLTGMKRIGLGVYTALAAENLSGLVEQYRDKPAVSVLKVIDDQGNVDIDRLYQAFVPMFADGQKQTIEIPMIGELIIDRSDVEKIYRYIKG